ncbi:MAG: hypothetical protein FWB93_01210 [Oscillospiraceae bacterium]|nr:hypothetical protein [Oscillospiraceae bacterium]
MKEKYIVIKNVLETDAFSMSFDYEIGDVIFTKNMYIIRLEIPYEVAKDNMGFDNIYGLNIKGEIIWQIEKPIDAFGLTETSQGYDYYFKSVYNDMTLTDDNIFYVFTFSMCYILDPQSGKIVGQKQM